MTELVADTVRDADGFLVDGHGNRLYEVTPPVARLHQDVVRAGWRHSYEITPYHNVRALLEVIERAGIDVDRRQLNRFAYRFILGYGPESTHRALDRLGVPE